MHSGRFGTASGEAPTRTQCRNHVVLRRPQLRQRPPSTGQVDQGQRGSTQIASGVPQHAFDHPHIAGRRLVRDEMPHQLFRQVPVRRRMRGEPGQQSNAAFFPIRPPSPHHHLLAWLMPVRPEHEALVASPSAPPTTPSARAQMPSHPPACNHRPVSPCAAPGTLAPKFSFRPWPRFSPARLPGPAERDWSRYSSMAGWRITSQQHVPERTRHMRAYRLANVGSSRSQRDPVARGNRKMICPEPHQALTKWRLCDERIAKQGLRLLPRHVPKCLCRLLRGPVVIRTSGHVRRCRARHAPHPWRSMHNRDTPPYPAALRHAPHYQKCRAATPGPAASRADRREPDHPAASQGRTGRTQWQHSFPCGLYSGAPLNDV